LFVIAWGAKYQGWFVLKHDAKELVHCSDGVKFCRLGRGGEKARIVKSKACITNLFVPRLAGGVEGVVRAC